MRKPRVFLSHSKQDKEIIEQLANDLRRARIDVWYDEWEIPPGESFRRKIFEDGIPNCDLFFIYLTENSKDSFWVSQELDAAFIHQMDRNSGGGFLAIFVSSDDVRRSLPLDLRSIHSPILSTELYIPSLMNLISRTWETTSKKLIHEESRKSALQLVTLEKQLAELENALLRATSVHSPVGIDKVLATLEAIEYTMNSATLSLKYIFTELSNLLATGTNSGHFEHRVKLLFGDDTPYRKSGDIRGSEVLGELIVRGLVQREAHTDGDFFALTELGRQVITHIRS